MKYLFIDTEATGLPLNDSFSIDAINNWPRLVSVAYILCDNRKIVRDNYSIIKPNGFITLVTGNFYESDYQTIEQGI